MDKARGVKYLYGMKLDDLKHAQRERLLYLDQRLTWRGWANRRDLMERFGVSVAQAAIDFRVYLEIAGRQGPDYDTERKTYVIRPDHKPLWPEATLGGWDMAVRDRPAEEFCELPLLVRATVPETMARLSRTMADSHAVQIRYTSMTTGEEAPQWIVPTRFASDGERIHVRAFSLKHNEYRDYVPARIHANSSFATRPPPSPLPFDADWHTRVRIKLAPRRSLSEAQARAVRREYGFRGETLVVEIRKALEFYTARRWGLNLGGARLEIVGKEYFAEETQ